MQLFIWVIIIGVILILGIIFLGVGLKFYKDGQACIYDYSPWCYVDWRCPNFVPGDPRHFPAKVAYQEAATCSQGISYKCKVKGLKAA